MPRQNKNKLDALDSIIKKCNVLLITILIYPFVGAALFIMERQHTHAQRIDNWMIIAVTVIGIAIAIPTLWYGIQGRKLDPKSPYDFDHPYNMAIVMGITSAVLWLLFANRLLGS